MESPKVEWRRLGMESEEEVEREEVVNSQVAECI
jgi:hypothetical protein